MKVCYKFSLSLSSLSHSQVYSVKSNLLRKQSREQAFYGQSMGQSVKKEVRQGSSMSREQYVKGSSLSSVQSFKGVVFQGSSLSRESVKGIFCLWNFCQGSSLSRESSVYGISVKGVVCQGNLLSRKQSVDGELCQGSSLSRKQSVDGVVCRGSILSRELFVNKTKIIHD